ncbi:TetR/AcrR family transcriptional regulator [Hydrogenimonas cancrithermarum]|uniref:TetR family transcriptional regulator n=1 Tax=Hydrogenimonas cancrithermarum TaxID=2993563 RepID=A0ABN6WTN0_9BACT|nr:TetR/AcrR family transcriptional regulator [Hydrogenimonas cancrithermarum]BDY12233.1 TetR family transcriptional regulator [Hydrogenimonas cancrithermarum]
MERKDTWEKVLEAALKLFNEEDTQRATTNHIAKAAGISPGNLYYHFRNKEAIIRALYREMTEKIGFEAKALPESMCEMKRYCTFVADVWWEYRFFRRELIFLMQRDPELFEAVARDNRMQHAKLLTLVEHLRENGYLLLPYDDAIEQLADTIMLYSQFWTPYLMSLGNDVGEVEVRMVTGRILGLFSPYLSEMAKAELSTC